MFCESVFAALMGGLLFVATGAMVVAMLLGVYAVGRAVFS